VYVSNYLDWEMGANLTPLKFAAGQFAGIDYLGSEFDYIQRTYVMDCYFGGGYYEADMYFAPRPRLSHLKVQRRLSPGHSSGAIGKIIDVDHFFLRNQDFPYFQNT
jgi:hypothetical protein